MKRHTITIEATEEPEGWFVQSNDIDYFACGESYEDAICRFINGLKFTLDEHIRRFGGVSKLVKNAGSLR
jgi:hypothetical protein